MTYISLSQLNKQVQQVLDNAFMGEFWVVGEIAQLQQAQSGHVYFELVEKNNQRIVAKMQGVIWYNKILHLRQKFGKDLFKLLKKGNKVLLKAVLEFHVVYGMKLRIEDMDASVTIGELELRRLENVEKLKSQGLIG